MSFDLLNSLGDMLSTEPDILEKHACDWSNVNRQRPRAVLRRARLRRCRLPFGYVMRRGSPLCHRVA